MLCDTVKTCYEATNGEDRACENTRSSCQNPSRLLDNALLALGKVPGPEAESASCKDPSFSRVCTAKKLRAELDERRTICRSKVMQADICG